MYQYSATARLSSNEPPTPSPASSFGRRYSIVSSTGSALEPCLSGVSSVVSPSSQPQTPVTSLPFSRDLFGTALMSKLQAVPQGQYANQPYNVVDPMHQLQLYSGKDQTGPHQFFAPEDVHTVLSNIKPEGQTSPMFYPSGLRGSSLDSGFGTAPSSFESTWSSYPNGLYGRSFDSGIDTAASSFASGWYDPELAFAGAEHSFGAPNPSPQLVGFPASQSPPVLASIQLRTWAPQPRTHVAPSDTHVDWASSLDIRLHLHSDRFDKTVDSSDITMGMYDSFNEGLIDTATDQDRQSTQVVKDSDTESDEKPIKSSRRCSRQPKSRSKYGGRLMRSDPSLRKRKRPAQRQGKTVYDRAGRPVTASLIPSNEEHRCHFETCKKSFARSEHLKRHLTAHGGGKPFKCPIPGCNVQSSKRPKESRSDGGEGPKAFNRSDNRLPHIVRHIERSTGTPRVKPSLSFEKVCNLIRDEVWGPDIVEKLERQKAYGKLCADAGKPCNATMCDGNHCSKLRKTEKPSPCNKGDDCSVTKRNIVELELNRRKEDNGA